MDQRKQFQVKPQQFSEQTLMFVLESVLLLEKYLQLIQLQEPIIKSGPQINKTVHIPSSAMVMTVSGVILFHLLKNFVEAI